MGWLFAPLYDRFMAGTEEACLAAWRAQLLADARGRVVEIGAGTGANLPHYRPEAVDRVLLCEPDPGMRRQLEARVDGATWAEVRGDGAEALEVEDSSVDTVVSTLVLCTVSDLDASIAEIRRVLRPGGQLLFLEHVAAEAGSDRRWWQHRLEPAWKWFAGGCHVTRETEAHLEHAGFTIERCVRESVRKAMPIVRPSIRGIARC